MMEEGKQNKQREGNKVVTKGKELPKMDEALRETGTGRQKVSTKAREIELKNKQKKIRAKREREGQENRKDGKVVVTALRLLLTIPHLYI